MTRPFRCPRALRHGWCAFLAVFLQLTAMGRPLRAQNPADRRVGSLPREIAREATTTFNAASTRRVRGDFTMSAADTIRSDVAVLEGNARIAGVITGQLLVLNGDAILAAGGRIDGALTVIGGTFESPERAAKMPTP
jgi:hypothetical protein